MRSEKSNKCELTISVYTSHSDRLSVNIQGFDIWSERGWNQAKTFYNLTLQAQNVVFTSMQDASTSER